MDLHPLYDGRDYASFGCLFGVRNDPGWGPVAADRGLPADASSALREEFDGIKGADAAVHSPTWVSWAELESLDPDIGPRGARGLLVVGDTARPTLEERHWVQDSWPDAVVERLGVPPLGVSPAAAPFGSWREGTAFLTWRRFTRRDALGPGTGWEHVFAVMQALAGRFGSHGVRLVVYFD